MEVGFLLKVAGVGVLCAVACMILSRAGREEQAVALSVAGVIAAALVLLTQAGNLISTIRGVFGF
ncbi:MAG: stage III sporulation protein AC [Clostridia bacterium]|nr:stage III sporulation protein AC [Clostridia bacterium]